MEKMILVARLICVVGGKVTRRKLLFKFERRLDFGVRMISDLRVLTHECELILNGQFAISGSEYVVDEEEGEVHVMVTFHGDRDLEELLAALGITEV